VCAAAVADLFVGPGHETPKDKKRKVLQGGHAATLQRTLGKRDCSQNDKMDRGGISLFSAQRQQQTSDFLVNGWHGLLL
jgi:hypothetical protein